jgi:single-stranded-DNA-specific exonuclease
VTASDPPREGAGLDAPPVDPGPASARAQALAAALKLTRTAAQVLDRAGREPGESTERWLDPKLAHLTAPTEMADRGSAASRIVSAIRRGERICVFGDYDCDGITSAAIMTSAIRQLGGEVVPLLATRTEGAYGLSAKALARVRASGAGLVVTCDCGSSDHERIDDARRAGVDTIVIDHHLVPKETLPAFAFLNPHRPECNFAFKHMASCGLALTMAAALRQELDQKLDLRPLLDLVAIGTIADVVPLIGDNRALTRAGLRVLSSGTRPGLRALAELAKVDLSYGVGGEDIAYRIAPRINAPGRLGDPDQALAVLLATDPTTAQGLAASIEQTQLQRRAVQAEMIAEAFGDLAEPALGDLAGIVLARQGWHPGVVGIVAGKIADQTRKPTIVIGLEGASGRGSVRGPRGFPLYDALVRCRDELVGFGGHQAAAGVHVRAERVDALRAAWADACADIGRGLALSRDDEPAARLDPRDDPAVVLRDLERLEPFGAENPTPALLLAGAAVRSVRNLKGHLKLELSCEGRDVTAVAFQRGALAEEVTGKLLDVVGFVRRNTYAGGAEVHVQKIALSGRAAR